MLIEYDQNALITISPTLQWADLFFSLALFVCLFVWESYTQPPAHNPQKFIKLKRAHVEEAVHHWWQDCSCQSAQEILPVAGKQAAGVQLHGPVPQQEDAGGAKTKGRK